MQRVWEENKMRTNKLLYVAGPYSGDTKENIIRAEEVSIGLIRNGFHVYTPHKNMAGYEQYEDDKIGYKTWIDMDLDILSRCDAIYVMKDSENSVGVQKETAFARKHKIPIFHESIYPHHSFTLDDYLSIVGERNA